MKKPLFLACVALTFALASCDTPERTVDTLRREIAAYKAAPDDVKQIEIEKNFVHLDEQIDALRKKGDRDKADDLAETRTTLRGDYQSARMGRAIQDAKSAIQGFGEAFKSEVKNIGDAFKGSGTSK